MSDTLTINIGGFSLARYLEELKSLPSVSEAHTARVKRELDRQLKQALRESTHRDAVQRLVGLGGLVGLVTQPPFPFVVAREDEEGSQ